MGVEVAGNHSTVAVRVGDMEGVGVSSWIGKDVSVGVHADNIIAAKEKPLRTNRKCRLSVLKCRTITLSILVEIIKFESSSIIHRESINFDSV